MKKIIGWIGKDDDGSNKTYFFSSKPFWIEDYKCFDTKDTSSCLLDLTEADWIFLKEGELQKVEITIKEIDND